MQDAKEASGYDRPVIQTALFTVYTVGPYAVYAPETGTWQWHNEDGTPRDGRPSPDEIDAQMRVSEKKLNKLRLPDIQRLFTAFARDSGTIASHETDSDVDDADAFRQAVHRMRKDLPPLPGQCSSQCDKKTGSLVTKLPER